MRNWRVSRGEKNIANYFNASLLQFKDKRDGAGHGLLRLGG